MSDRTVILMYATIVVAAVFIAALLGMVPWAGLPIEDDE